MTIRGAVMAVLSRPEPGERIRELGYTAPDRTNLGLALKRFDHDRLMRNFRSVSTTKHRAKESSPSA